MYKKYLATLLIIVSVLTVCVGCTVNKEDYIFGTFYSLEINGKNAKQTQKRIEDDWKNLENTYSTAVQSSFLSKLNKSPANTPIAVSQTTLDLFKVIEFWNAKNEEFNPAIFPLVNLWKFSPIEFTGTVASIPTAQQIADTLPLCAMSNFVVDYANATITKKCVGAMLDFGGFLKGYAADVASEYAKDTEYLINIGGTIKSNKNISVAISSPRGAGYAASFNLNNEASATSGDYERFYIYDGVRYCHIIGSSGYPAQSKNDNAIISVTIVGKDAMICDILSTLIFIIGKEGAFIVEEIGYSAYILTNDTYYTIGEKSFEPLGIWKK